MAAPMPPPIRKALKFPGLWISGISGCAISESITTRLTEPGSAVAPCPPALPQQNAETATAARAQRIGDRAAASGGGQQGIDHLRAGELRLDVADARFDHALLVARGVVLGVLGKVAVRARLGDCLRDARTLDALQGLQLAAQQLRAAQGHGRLHETTGSARA